METEPILGKTIGDFHVEELVGRGGMASVYRAKQISFQRDVALKVINVAQVYGDNDVFTKRFQKEASFISSLEHIHILPVYAYGLEGPYAYLAMRLMRGGSLKELLQTEKPLPLERAVRIFDQVARGLAYAHSKGIIHRDIKTGNILLDDNENAYLMDFGLARMVDSQDQLTRTDSLVGTVAYMAPEQLRGEPLDNRADIYAMGILLYEMVCGQLPFKDAREGDIVTMMYKHLEEQPIPPRQVNPNLPPELEGVILRALAKEPDDRYNEMADMARAVRAASGMTWGSTDSFPLANTAIKGTIAAKRHTQQAQAINTQRSLWMAVAVILVVMVMGFAFLAMRPIAPVILPTPTPTLEPTPLPKFSILTGESAVWDTLQPSPEHITRAQATLGASGFIGVFACNRSSEYHATLTREITERARGYGLRFQVYDADSDAFQQRLLLEQALTDGAQAFIVCPLDYSVIDEALKSVDAADLPLISHENEKETYGGAVTSNPNANYEIGLTAGAFAGEYIRDELNGEARVLILDYPDLAVIVERADGLEAGVLSVAPNATIIGRHLGATRDFAYESVSKLLAEGVRFDVIVSINDAGSYGAIDALVEAEIGPNEVFIASVDAEQQALRFIQDDYYIRGSLEVGRQSTAYGAVDMITRMLAGEAVPQTMIVSTGKMITRADLATPAP